jgi:hypothetical protein
MGAAKPRKPIRHEHERPVRLVDDPTWRTKFLESLLVFEGDVKKAATQAGIAPVIAYTARHRDPDFAQDWEDVSEVLRIKKADGIEEALYDRAVNGSKKTFYDRATGNITAEEKVFDTPAAVVLLKGYRPDRFVEDRSKRGPSDVESIADMFRALAEERKAAARIAEAQQRKALPAPVDAEVSIADRARAEQAPR